MQDDWSWGSLPIGRVVNLVGAPAEAIQLALDPLPDDGPAIVRFTVGGVSSAASVVEPLLDELEAAARQLFPVWLPGAADIHGQSRLELDAVKILAARRASTTQHFGPFLAALAEASILDVPMTTQFAKETRLIGLARVLADSYHRDHAVLLLAAPRNLTTDAQNSLAAACSWLAEYGRFGVWLVGQPLPDIDRFRSEPVRLPSDVLDLFTDDEFSAGRDGALGVATPAVEGTAHGPTEKKVDRALSECIWARGRKLNYRYHATALTTVKIVDIVWLDERCVVEIDGPEHYQRAMQKRDERRDRELEKQGFRVLRIPNWQVHKDLPAVVSAIEDFLHGRRSTPPMNAPRSTEGTVQ